MFEDELICKNYLKNVANARFIMHVAICCRRNEKKISESFLQSYTDVGKTTSDYLSIHEAHRIFLENKSKFTASNFSEGLMDILQGYRRATQNMIENAKSRKNLLNSNMSVIAGAIVGSVLLLGILLFIGFIIYRRCRNKKEEVRIQLLSL